jgi:hypothetical protein
MLGLKRDGDKRRIAVYTVAKTPGFSEMQQIKRYL